MLKKLSLSRAFVGFLVAASCLTSQQGSDLEIYDRWSQVAVSGEINQIRFKRMTVETESEIPTLTSVNGIQYRHWSAGPGLLIAIFRVPLIPIGLDRFAAYLAGAFSIAVFWLMCFRAASRLSDEFYATFLIGIAYVGTGLGFYSCYVGLETYTLLPIGLVLNEFSKQLKGERVSVWGVGVATGMLWVFRSYLAAYAWCVLIPSFFGVLRGRDSLFRKGVSLCGLIVPLLLAFYQVGTVHWWMTGDALRSPYAFGDSHFRSLDSACPYWWNVLFSPFHGAWLYSPVTGLGILCASIVGGLEWRRRERRASVGWALLITAVLVNVYIAGCWHNWWMAAWFGNRNLYLPGAVAVLGIAAVIRLLNGRRRMSLMATCAVFAFWSFLLLQRGRISYSSVGQMVSDIQVDLAYWGTIEMSVCIALCGVLAAAIVYLQFQTKPNREKIIVATVVALSLSYLADRILLIQPNSVLTVATILVSLAVGLKRVRVPVVHLVQLNAVVYCIMIALFVRLHIQSIGKTYANPEGQIYADYDLLYNVKSTTGLEVIETEREQMLQFLRRIRGEDWYLQYRKSESDLPTRIEQRSYPMRKRFSRYRYL